MEIFQITPTDEGVSRECRRSRGSGGDKNISIDVKTGKVTQFSDFVGFRLSLLISFLLDELWLDIIVKEKENGFSSLSGRV